MIAVLRPAMRITTVLLVALIFITNAGRLDRLLLEATRALISTTMALDIAIHAREVKRVVSLESRGCSRISCTGTFLRALRFTQYNF
jgi:hypothetical protein